MICPQCREELTRAIDIEKFPNRYRCWNEKCTDTWIEVATMEDDS